MPNFAAMRIIVGITMLWLIVCSCGTRQAEPEKKDSTVEKSYFPIAEYVQGEIRTVDSLPLGIKKKYTVGKKTDSAFIERPEFHELSKDFWDTSLSKSSLEKNYTENAFKDESTGYFTFNYQPKSQDAMYRRIDVLVKPGGVVDKVRSIYIERSYNSNDTLINERLYWQANISFSIIKEKKYKNEQPVIEQLQVIWDPSSY
jgi:hypothetical protein